MISWGCVTYKREKYLPGLVKCFHNQDLKKDMELVIINDDPGVEYVYDHPSVKIYNLDYRFTNIYKKIEYCASVCNGEFFMPVSDDDEFKPWATSTMFENLRGGRFITFNGYFKKIKDDKLLWRDEVIMGVWMCERDLMGEYGKGINGHGSFFRRIKEAGYYREFVCDKENAFFIWNRTSDHSNWGKKIIDLGGGNDS